MERSSNDTSSGNKSHPSVTANTYDCTELANTMENEKQHENGIYPIPSWMLLTTPFEI